MIWCAQCVGIGILHRSEWFCWSGCSCNGRTTFCADVAKLCSPSSKGSDYLTGLSQGCTVAALNTKTWLSHCAGKGYGANPCSACWHEQLGLTACICLGIHQASSLKILAEMGAALQHLAVADQPGAVLFYTDSQTSETCFPSCFKSTGILNGALSCFLKALLLKTVQYVPERLRTTVLLLKTSTPASSGVTELFNRLLLPELVKSKGDVLSNWNIKLMDLISAAAPGISQISEVMDVGYTCNLLVFSLLLLLDLSVGFMGYWGGARILSHALTKAFNKNPQLEIGIEKYKSVAVNKYRILPLDFIFSFTGLWRNAGDHSWCIKPKRTLFFQSQLHNSW